MDGQALTEKTPPTLLLSTGGVVHEVDPGVETRLGRDPGSDVVVPGGSVSRLHAVVRWDGRRWWLIDAGSSHGSFVGGRPITSIALEVGSTEVRLGSPTGDLVTAQLGATQRPAGPASDGDRPGSVVRTRPMSPVIRIGRHHDNDLVLDDLSVSRHHAVVRQRDGGWTVDDLGSSSGTFVDGQRVQTSQLGEGQRLALGRHILVMSGGQLVDHVDDTVSLQARDLVVEVGGQRILDHVSFAADAGQLVAVIGPTGAGKSTLIKALSGYSRPTSGTVTYNGQDVHASLGQLRSRIGYVPQDDICHVQLRLGVALTYAAELRFPTDAGRDARHTRVAEVLDELGLAHRRSLRIDKLSGGQRKRASIAMELLTRPALMFCDEPTSGLDPAYERSVTELLRGLADGGRTILVVTHSVASLHLYDRVLCLAPGGRPAFYGPPTEAIEFFGVADWPSLFSLLEHEARDWTGELEAHPLGGKYVSGPLARRTRPLPPGHGSEPRSSGLVRQTWTLLRRSVTVTLASRLYAVLLLAQAPVIALILLAAVGTGQLNLATLGVLTGRGNIGSRATLLLALLVVATVTIGLVNACRELVKEQTVWQRERAVGLGVAPYLAAKLIMVTAIAAVQVLMLCLIAVRPQRAGPGAVLSSGTIELGLVLLAVAFTSSVMGLAISALARQEAVALVAVPVVVVAQMVLCGAFIDVGSKPVLQQAAWTVPSYWGYNAAGSTTSVLRLDPFCAKLESLRADAPNSPQRKSMEASGPVPCSQRSRHEASVWVWDMVGVLGLCPLLLGVTWLVLARRRPG